MQIYVKINENLYPAVITGRIHDKDWDDRASKAITVEMSYEEAVALFDDDIEWEIVQEEEEQVEKLDENGEPIYTEEGESVFETVINQEAFDNSEYSIAGDIVDHRNGQITVKMGKPTADELLAILMGGEII